MSLHFNFLYVYHTSFDILNEAEQHLKQLRLQRFCDQILFLYTIKLSHYLNYLFHALKFPIYLY